MKPQNKKESAPLSHKCFCWIARFKSRKSCYICPCIRLQDRNLWCLLKWMVRACTRTACLQEFQKPQWLPAETQKRTMHVIFQNYKSQNIWWGRALLMASSRRPNCAANENRNQGGNQSNYEPKRCRTVCGRRKLMLHSSNVAHKQPLNSQHLSPDLAADACLWRCWW